ncbi:receptor-like protein 7 [Rosa rugosa]|uniref:receptor-like protein 7 n=1 Tax=Rosa rugosa TaxID=74645 RepID=UPI002B414831|nr:receptor-like protein 7 [Rosa rugosa]
MGASRLCNGFSVHFLLLLLLNITHSFSFVQTLCNVDDRYALLQFKKSFTINKSASEDPFAHPKVASWTRKGVGRSNCCSWDGVECDKDTGHVVGLYLRSSRLFGSLNSNSGLFQLAHLQKLDLSDNHFNFSEIPSRLGHLTSLTYLNLSKSSFSGQIPSEISKLSKLSAIDLSFNYEHSTRLLRLEKASQLRSLVQNLTNLKQLHLSGVYMPFTVPDVLVNASSLTSLRLENCGLIGEFPVGIFHLPNLQVLDLDTIQDLAGHFPDFNRSSPLEYLNVARTNFSGGLPDSIGNLRSLKFLNIEYLELHPHVPSSLGNLTQLNYLDLSFFFDRSCTHQDSRPHNFSLIDSDSWSWIGKLTELYHLGLGHTYLSGEFPTFVSNLTQLRELSLDHNQITGHIPSWLVKFTQLTLLNLRFNNLQGAIPRSLFHLHNLEYLDLCSNKLIGSVVFDNFPNLKKLRVLQLSSNKLSLQIKNDARVAVPKLEVLKLGSCNLTEFPGFLRNHSGLVELDLSGNYIQGQIPKWMWNSSRETLLYLNLSGNSLSGFDQNLVVLPWSNLLVFELGFNMIQGSLPTPPPTIKIYSVPGNVYSGEMSVSFCNLSSLLILDLSNNNLSGLIPQCLGNSDALEILNLRNNSFQGEIPPMCTNGISFKSIDLSENMLQGKLPTSMANCTRLEFLALANNQISGILPAWLWALPVLRVLSLRSNRFHGTIGMAATNLESSKLCIIDLSNNSFSGMLPSNFIENWNCLKSVSIYEEGSTVFQDTCSIGAVTYPYDYSMSLSGIGVQLKPLKYANFQNPFHYKVIDLSSNKFEGEIPGAIGNLVGLQILSLSNNNFSGNIPSSLRYLRDLLVLNFSRNQLSGDILSSFGHLPIEVLDLSWNHLSGEIPTTLTQLNFLAVFSVSHNNLSGPIPRGIQLDTFESSSYLGNPGLCGFHLLVKCEDSEISNPPPPSHIEEDHQDPGFPFEWRVFFPAGLVSGLVVGFVAGNTLTTNKQQWFVEKFCRRRRQPRGTRGRRAHRNF